MFHNSFIWTVLSQKLLSTFILCSDFQHNIASGVCEYETSSRNVELPPTCDPQIKESTPRPQGLIWFVGEFLKLGFERELIDYWQTIGGSLFSRLAVGRRCE